jgi:hypothetical protein
MPNYSKGKIYTIRFHNSNEIYIGSTTQSLAVRFGGHKRRDNSAVYRLIQDKYDGNWQECYYELYENYSCNNKEELCKKEGEIIRLFKNDENYDCINCVIIGRTKKEYKKDNPQMVKKYYQNNKDKILEKNKQYYKNNIEKEKEKRKQFRVQNTDKIKEQNKKYRKENADKIKENNKEKITCDCGSCINKIGILRHLKTKIHQNYLSSLPAVICDCNESHTEFITISI